MGFSLRNIGKKIEDIAGGVVNQVNFLDQGRTFSHPNVVAPPQGQPAPSAFQQATHSGASNFIGQNIIKPLGQFPIDTSAQIYNQGVAPVFNLPKLNTNQSSFSPEVQNIAKNVGATGSLHQTVGSGLQTALTLGGGGLAKGIESGITGIVAPNVARQAALKTTLGLGSQAIPKTPLIARVGSNAAIGAGFNASAAAGQGAKPLDIAKSAGQGAALGGALPVAGAGAKIAVKPVVKLASNAVDNRVPLNAVGGGKPFDSKTPSLPPKVSLKTPPTPESTPKISGQGTKVVQKVNITPEAEQFARVFNTTPEDATTQLAKLKQEQSTAVAKQLVEPPAGQSNVSSGIKRQLSIRPAKNPMTPGPLDNQVGFAPIAEGDAGQPYLNAQFVSEHLKRIGGNADAEVSKLSSADQTRMKQIQTKGVAQVAPKAENPGQFIKAEAALRNYYDTRIAYDHLHGIPTPYRQNYLRDLIPPQESAGTRTASGANKSPGYTMPKENPSATGVLEGLRKDVAGSSFNHAKIAYQNGLEQAFPGQISTNLTTGEGGVSKQLLTPYGQELSAPKELASKINRRASVSATDNLPRGAMKVYDAGNRGLKYTKLGGGTFHAVTTAGTTGGQQLASGAAFTHPVDSLRIIAGTLSRKAHDTNMARHAASGNLDRAVQAGVTLRPDQILADADLNAFAKMKNSRLNFIKNVHDMVFQRQIPEAKLTMFEQQTKGLDPRNAADLAKMRKVASAVNNLGGINRAVEGTTPRQLQVLGRAVLATDFTEGKFRTLAAGLTKWGANSPEGKIARQMIIGKTIVYALPGLGVAIASGKVNSSDPKALGQAVLDQVLDPQVQTPFKTKTGIPKTAKTPETFVSELGRVVRPLFDSGQPDKTSGLQHYATARTAALPSALIQAKTNQDYFGNPVIARNPDGSLNVKKSGENVGLSNAPIPIVQGQKAIAGKQTPGESVINTLGFRVTADKNDPRMKAMAYSQGVVGGLPGDLQSKYNDAHGIRTDQYGNKQTTVPAGNGAHNADILLQDTVHGQGKLIEAGAKIDAYNRKLGLPGDPFYTLNKDQQTAVLLMQQDKTRNPAEAKNISNQNNSWLPQYYSSRSAYFDKLNLPPSTKIQELPEPFADKQTSTDLGTMASLDGAQKAQFIADHPNITSYLNDKAKWVNDNRTIEHRPELDTYPTASPDVQKVIDTYNSIPKGGGKKGGNLYRSQWIQSHPQQYAAMGNYFTQASLYGLEQDAAQAQYKNTGFSQKGLKDIVSLAKYDIGTTKDTNGNTIYALGGGGAGSSGGSGGSGSSYNKYASGSYLRNKAIYSSKNPYKYTVSSKFKKAKISSRSSRGSKAKVASRSSGLPKVSLKPSKV